MEKLFGIPMTQLMITLLIIFGVGVVVMALLAMRNRVAFKMGVRNIPRRRAQTILIVLGLMLGTLLFSASFTTGDTLTHSFRVQALKTIGEVDVIVEADRPEATNDFVEQPEQGVQYFDATYTDRVRERLAEDPQVEGVAPIISELAPVVAPATGLSEPQVSVLGLDEGSMRGFDRLETADGLSLSLNDLGEGQAYLSTEAAKELGVKQGDKVQAYLGTQPVTLEVAGLLARGAVPGNEMSLVMPLTRLQAATGNAGKVTGVLITHKGPSIAGGDHTAETLTALQPLLDGSQLQATPVKQDFLKQADTGGAQFASFFLIFGQFSIAAGVMLIFLIFVMLAAERKKELGIARGVGMQRAHLVRMFTFEGAVYSLLAAAAGSMLGVAIGWAMVRVIAAAFGTFGFDIQFAFSWRSLVVAYTLGMAITFMVVLVSSWRVSRLNVIRAIRDIPEPTIRHRSWRRLVLTLLLPVIGVLLTLGGISGEQMGLYMLGTSMIIIGIPLLLRRLGLPERAMFTLAGVGLLVWWLLPFDTAPGNMNEGIEMFFLSGIMIVIGAVWVVIYNSDLLLNAIVGVFGRVRGLPPVLKTAVSYPMQNRFRTGMTLAMFALVVFTLSVMSFILNAFGAVYDDTSRFSGGFDIRSSVGYTNPIPDIRAALENAEGVSPQSFTAIGSMSAARVKAKQDATANVAGDVYLQAVDPEYAENVNYGFRMRARGYNTDREVWSALQQDPNTVVVASWMIPAKSDFNVGGITPPIKFEGFYREDDVLPEVYVHVQAAGGQARLKVIGALDDVAYYAGNVLTSRAALNTLAGESVPPQTYLFRVRDGVDADSAANALERHFVANGMQADALAEEIRKEGSASKTFNNLLTGFMGLGLFVGIAALGVIAARSVVERRQQIGVLRAMGFQKSQVQLAFLIESSFVALLGVSIGIALGAALSKSIIDEIATDVAGLRYEVPWGNLLVIIAIAYGASILTTFLPARQASRIYPAEALRYE